VVVQVNFHVTKPDRASDHLPPSTNSIVNHIVNLSLLKSCSYFDRRSTDPLHSIRLVSTHCAGKALAPLNDRDPYRLLLPAIAQHALTLLPPQEG
jgi:hypothetical protein